MITTKMCEITNPAYKRAKKRLGLNKLAINRLANIAYERGITHANTKGKVRKYLDKLWLQHKKCNNVRVYGENIFLFQGNLLLTVYKLDNDLSKFVKNIKGE